MVHSISLPPGEYGGDAIERLFCNRLDAAAHPYFQEIADLRAMLVGGRYELLGSWPDAHSNFHRHLLLDVLGVSRGVP